MADPVAPDRGPGIREVVIVAVAVVAIVLGAAVATSLLPAEIQGVVFHTPLLIVILAGGTGWWLWRVSRRGASRDDR